MSVDLRDGIASSGYSYVIDTGGNGQSGGASVRLVANLSGIENVVGSNGNDSLTGDSNANVLDGGLGNDTLWGGGGTDTLIGGPVRIHLSFGTVGDATPLATSTSRLAMKSTGLA